MRKLSKKNVLLQDRGNMFSNDVCNLGKNVLHSRTDVMEKNPMTKLNLFLRSSNGAPSSFV